MAAASAAAAAAPAAAHGLPAGARVFTGADDAEWRGADVLSAAQFTRPALEYVLRRCGW